MTPAQPHASPSVDGTRCTARTRSGARCKNPPMVGSTVCRMHGGAARQVRAAAGRRVEQARVEREVSRTLGELGVPIPTSDGEGLQELRDRYRMIVNALWDLASGLKLVPEDGIPGGGTNGIYGRTYHQTGIATGEAKPNVVMVMLGEWCDRLAKVDEACTKLGLADRRVRAEEAELVLLAGAVDLMLARVVPPEYHERCRTVLAGELRRLDERPAPPAGEVA